MHRISASCNSPIPSILSLYFHSWGLPHDPSKRAEMETTEGGKAISLKDIASHLLTRFRFGGKLEMESQSGIGDHNAGHSSARHLQSSGPGPGICRVGFAR